MKKVFAIITLIVGVTLTYKLGHTCGYAVGYTTAETKNAEEASFLDSHEATDLVMHCMDFRFQGMEHQFTCNVCGKKADKLSWPGAVKIINSDDPRLRNEALEAIGIAIDKHGTKKIHLINHIDCGKYGGSSKHASLTDERQFHINELSRAAKIIHDRFNKLIVRIYVASRDGIEEITPQLDDT